MRRRGLEYCTAESFLTVLPLGDTVSIECEVETLLAVAASDGAPPPSSSRRYVLDVPWPLTGVPMFVYHRRAYDDEPGRTQVVFVRAWGGSSRGR